MSFVITKGFTLCVMGGLFSICLVQRDKLQVIHISKLLRRVTELDFLLQELKYIKSTIHT
jgi:hypothetical protein